MADAGERCESCGAPQSRGCACADAVDRADVETVPTHEPVLRLVPPPETESPDRESAEPEVAVLPGGVMQMSAQADDGVAESVPPPPTTRLVREFKGPTVADLMGRHEYVEALRDPDLDTADGAATAGPRVLPGPGSGRRRMPAGVAALLWLLAGLVFASAWIASL